MPLHNNINVILKGSKNMVTEITKKIAGLTTPLSFEAPHHETPIYIRMNLMPLKVQPLHGLHFCR